MFCYDLKAIECIRQIHRDNCAVSSAPRIHAELRMAHGIKISRKWLERLMTEAGISGVIAKKRAARRSGSTPDAIRSWSS